MNHLWFVCFFVVLVVDEFVWSTVAQTIIITGFTLLDAQSNVAIRPLVDQDTIDLNTITVPITIRCDIAETVVVDAVQFDLDQGSTIRVESTAPYFLGGDSDGDAAAVASLQNLGPHILVATAIIQQEIVSELSIQFNVINSSLDVSPTATPLSVYDVSSYHASGDGTLNGELRLWHKITLGFTGSPTGERNNIVNPFTDFALDVTFVHDDTNQTYVVPGFYAANGDAANSGAAQGMVWLCHFRPTRLGRWSWISRYVQGTNVAMDATVTTTSGFFFDGATGSFIVEDTDKLLPDLRARGFLRYVGEHHLQFEGDRTYFLKAGADSPENFLAYTDFDDTPNNRGYRKDWAPHIMDYQPGDPTWAGGKGQGILGAINYLSSKGMNVISFLTMNIQGDDQNVYPYLTANVTDFLRIDVSKTAQWDVVMDHAEARGMTLHFKTQETENDQLLDDGELGLQRKLYFRELIARFGHHLALFWNLGEENTNTDTQRKAFADYFKAMDPYSHPVIMHTFPGAQDENYTPLLGYPSFDGVSLQTSPRQGFNETLKWVTRSAQDGRKWIVGYDEQSPATEGVAPDDVDPNHDDIRKNVLWANLMAGGAGVEYYFGYGFDNSDLTLQDFRSRSNMWEQSRHALNFFDEFPYWRMVNANDLVTTDAWCLWDYIYDAYFVLYLPNGGTSTIDIPAISTTDVYEIFWFDPLIGGDLQKGSVASLSSDVASSIGLAPYNNTQDWAILLKCQDCKSQPALTLLPSTSTTSSPVDPGNGSLSENPSSHPTTSNAPTMNPMMILHSYVPTVFSDRNVTNLPTSMFSLDSNASESPADSDAPQSQPSSVLSSNSSGKNFGPRFVLTLTLSTFLNFILATIEGW